MRTVSGIDDIDRSEVQCLYTALHYLPLGRLNGRSTLNHFSARREKASPLFVKRPQGGEVLVRNCLCKPSSELLDFRACAHALNSFSAALFASGHCP